MRAHPSHILENTTTEGSNAARDADARPGMIELTFIHADLAVAKERIALVGRLSAAEHDFMLRQDGAGRDAVLARWQQINALIHEALAEVDQAHARLETVARSVFQAVGDAEDRDREEENRQT